MGPSVVYANCNNKISLSSKISIYIIRAAAKEDGKRGKEEGEVDLSAVGKSAFIRPPRKDRYEWP